MPIHDWTRVDAGVFHSFHTTWIGELTIRLNAGLLPPDYFALGEQIAGEAGPDVLTLQEPTGAEKRPEADDGGIGLAVATAPPKVLSTAETEAQYYLSRQRRLVIRHASGNRIVAFLEIVSPGNKGSQRAFDSFLDKAYAALDGGIHLLLIDLLPPTNRDPRGIHDALWEGLCGQGFTPPPGKDRTLAAYTSGLTKKAYVEPVSVGQPLTPMPLFLTDERYVYVPLEETYQSAFEGVPRIYRKALEAEGGSGTPG
jgi:hypothetical protein